jgi:hypothetical protein
MEFKKGDGKITKDEGIFQWAHFIDQ